MQVACQLAGPTSPPCVPWSSLALLQRGYYPLHVCTRACQETVGAYSDINLACRHLPLTFPTLSPLAPPLHLG